MAQMRIAVRAKPGSSRTRVGGSYGPDRQLIVAVSAPAVDGKANEAVIRAVAGALGVPRRAIEVASGHTARTKVLVVEADEDELRGVSITLDRLRAGAE